MKVGNYQPLPQPIQTGSTSTSTGVRRALYSICLGYFWTGEAAISFDGACGRTASGTVPGTTLRVIPVIYKWTSPTDLYPGELVANAGAAEVNFNAANSWCSVAITEFTLEPNTGYWAGYIENSTPSSGSMDIYYWSACPRAYLNSDTGMGAGTAPLANRKNGFIYKTLGSAGPPDPAPSGIQQENHTNPISILWKVSGVEKV